MNGVIGVSALRTKYGTFKIIIEAKDQHTYEKLVRKLRLIGVYVTVEKL